MMRAAQDLRRALAAATLALPLAWSAGPVAAQAQPSKSPRAAHPPQQQGSTAANVPNAVQGFSKNRNQPINIEASSLEVQDKSKIATFRGKVHVTQGDTELRCNSLVVHYEDGRGGGTNGSRSSLPNPDAQQRIRLLEAKGNVVVTQHDQIATGDTGLFDMPKNTITLRGNVVVSQGKNVLRGDRLVVDMTTGVSRVESDRGRVQGLFQPSEKEGNTKRDGSAIMPKLR